VSDPVPDPKSPDAAARATALGRGRFLLHDGARATLAYAVTDGADAWVWLDGHAYLVRPAEPARADSRIETDALAMEAPMPATVRAIAVTVGQSVVRGDVLIVLEAMKMELAIKASRDGIIRAVRCAPGDMVQPGALLVEFE
jgi:3-methylcrotonyl-CoA carboxylase alpha subunit